MAGFNLITFLGLDASDYTKGLDTASKKTDIFKSSLDESVKSLKNVYETLVGAAAGIAAVTYGSELFKSSMESTILTSEKWEAVTTSASFATDIFKQSLANMDFSHLLGGLEKAIKLGAEYREFMDQLEKKQRGSNIFKSEKETEIAHLKVLIAQSKSKEDVIKYNKEIIKLEGEIYEKQKEISQSKFDEQTKIFAEKAGVGEESVKKFVGQTGNAKELEEEAKAFIKVQNDYNELMNNRAITSPMGLGMIATTDTNTPATVAKEKELFNIIKNTKDETKEYVKLLQNLKPDEVKEISASWIAANQSTTEYWDSIKRATKGVNSAENRIAKDGDRKDLLAEKNVKQAESDAIKITKLTEIQTNIQLDQAKTLSVGKTNLALAEVDQWREGEIQKVNGVKMLSNAEINLLKGSAKEAAIKAKNDQKILAAKVLAEIDADTKIKKEKIKNAEELEERTRQLAAQKDNNSEDKKDINYKFSIGTINDKQLRQELRDNTAKSNQLELDDLKLQYDKKLLTDKEYRDEYTRLTKKFVKEKERSDDEESNVKLKKEKALNDNLTSIALSSINKLGSNLAKSFADIITGVKGAGFGELFKSILSTLGEFITQMGAAVMAYAVTMEAFKHAFSDPYIAIAAGFGLMVMGGIVSNLANSIGGKSKGFASGGIVGGSAFEGDNVHVRVNSGEMILNKNQQSTLFALANGAKPSGDIPAFKVDFKILGNNLVGVLNNHNNRLKNIR